MATPAIMAKKAARQTTEILKAVELLAAEVVELAAEVAELKTLIKLEKAPPQMPARSKPKK